MKALQSEAEPTPATAATTVTRMRRCESEDRRGTLIGGEFVASPLKAGMDVLQGGAHHETPTEALIRQRVEEFDSIKVTACCMMT